LGTGGAKRILVYGVTGSGKTTLASQISELTGLPWHSVDDEIEWLPGWVERPREEQREVASPITSSGAWILDSAYGHWRDVVVARAELIVAWHFRSFARKRARTGAWQTDPSAPPVLRLRSPRMTQEWLATLRTVGS
jgi:adenylate kinase family enzyme